MELYILYIHHGQVDWKLLRKNLLATTDCSDTRAEHLVFTFDGNTPLRMGRKRGRNKTLNQKNTYVDPCNHNNSTKVEPATSALFMIWNLISLKVWSYAKQAVCQLKKRVNYTIVPQLGPWWRIGTSFEKFYVSVPRLDRTVANRAKLRICTYWRWNWPPGPARQMPRWRIGTRPLAQ